MQAPATNLTRTLSVMVVFLLVFCGVTLRKRVVDLRRGNRSFEDVTLEK